MITNDVQKRVLPNGLTVLVKKYSAWPVAAIVTYVKVGYFNEPDRLVGISHMIEHMFFKGTQRRGVGDIAIETKSLGGYLNASTIYDHTLYYTVLPSRHLAEGLDIQSDALINSTFDPEELSKETEVVIQEAHRKLDMPTAVAREKLFELAFDKHRIRRWRIGTEEGLRALTRDDFIRFHRDLYRPENIILVVVGDLDTDSTFAAVEDHYADFSRGTLKKEESPSEPIQTRSKYLFMSGDIQQAQLMIGFRSPEILHPDSYAMEILAFLLGRGRSSNLFQNVKERKNLVHGIGASNYTQRDLGVFLIEANVAPDKVRAAEDAIFEEIERAKSHLFSAEALGRAKRLIEAIYVSGLESVAGQANILAEFEALGDFRLAEDYLQKLYDVSAEDVQRVATSYLGAASCSMLEYVPRKAGLKPLDKKPALTGPPKKSPAGIQDRTKSRDVEDLRGITSVFTKGDGRKEVAIFELAGGVKVLVKESSQLPLVSVGVFAKGGRKDESPGNCGITSLALRTALKGTEKRSASQLAAEIEGLGSSIQFSNDADYASFSMNILSKNFAAGFDVLSDVILNATFPEDELAKEKDHIFGLQLRERDDMFGYPLKLFFSAFFGQHPYGLSPIGHEESIRSASRSDVSAWQARLFRQNELLYVFVGDVQAERMRDEVEARMGGRRSSEIQPGEILDLEVPTTVVESAETRNKEQTALALGFAGPSYLQDNYYALTVLQNVVSGLGGRFFEELRGRQSLAYTVTTFLISRLAGGTFVSYIATSPEKEKVAREGLLKEFEKLRNAPISEAELQQAIRYTVGTHQISLETNRARMQQYAHNELLGKGVDEIERFPAMIESVTADGVLSAAQEYFDLNRYALGVVRGHNGSPKN